MNHKEKLQTLDEQIRVLQEKKKKLEDKNFNERIKLFKKLDIESIPLDILAGSLTEAVEAFHQKRDVTKRWEEKGRAFFESAKKKIGDKNSNSFRASSKLEKTTHANESKTQ